MNTKNKDEINTYQLNPRQLKFVHNYVSKEFFGNGMWSYADAYNIDINDAKQANSARHGASILLRDINICKLINEKLEAEGLNDSFVDKQLLYLITQKEDKSASLGAIKEYNKLKQRIEDKLKIEGNLIIDVNFLKDEDESKLP